MSITRTLGGDRLGAGKKNFVSMRSYDRSTHDLSYIWRSTMAPGTLVPFMNEVALPGDTFDIDLNCEIMTHPTVGPLFGSYKVQLDVFMIPVRLYNWELHNNKLGIGNKMADIKLPQVRLKANEITHEKIEGLDNKQINPSCIFSYLNIRGLGKGKRIGFDQAVREFNAVPYIGYWDIYKNYYANKQEEIGAVIHNAPAVADIDIEKIEYWEDDGGWTLIEEIPEYPAGDIRFVNNGTLAKFVITTPAASPEPDWTQVMIMVAAPGSPTGLRAMSEIALDTITETAPGSGIWEATNLLLGTTGGNVIYWRHDPEEAIINQTPQVYTFPLNNIDELREKLMHGLGVGEPFIIDENELEPFNLPLLWTGTEGTEDAIYSKQTNLEGLALKTYQSDLFNNWIQTEWIDGVDGISAVTAISTVGDSFTIDTLNISKKVYDMLNRIALSGGSYKDWIDTVYTETDAWIAEVPMYMGGLIKELVFQEVISNSESADQPLGTLAGRGVMAKKHKGGKITVKVKEPSWIMGIISLTPRLDYSQGNKWDVNLKTMDDFHKPALDEIGFQDLITDQMAWWDTDIIPPTGELDFNSAGKQPAWINYMTNVNQVRGNFAIEGNEMFMTLNRKYEQGEDGHIIDLTTYIDPIKFNDIFAETARDAQNFWTQIGVGITARRIMSAKLIPNL